jgi:hypothetical protein
MSEKGWIGVDLDGTLAEYNGWQGPTNIGDPILPMINRVKQWIKEGKQVKILTAHACIDEQIPPVKEWLKKQGIGELEVTNQKDFMMIELWDDRCVQLIPNTGIPVDERRR